MSISDLPTATTTVRKLGLVRTGQRIWLPGIRRAAVVTSREIEGRVRKLRYRFVPVPGQPTRCGVLTGTSRDAVGVFTGRHYRAGRHIRAAH